MNYLGKIEIPSGTSKNNRTTASPFLMSDMPGMAVILVPDTSTVGVEFGAGDAFATTAARGLPLKASERAIITKPDATVALAVFNPTGGAAVVNVWEAARDSVAQQIPAAKKIAFADSPYTPAGETFLHVDTSGGAVVVNLPATVGAPSAGYRIKRVAGSNACTLTPNGAETIDGAATRALDLNEAAFIVPDSVAGEWYNH